LKKTKPSGNSFIETKLGKVAATLVAVLLIFAGSPTLSMDWRKFLKVKLGCIRSGWVCGCWFVGLFLMRFLVQKKIISKFLPQIPQGAS
jgi:hypothetical protein